MSWDEIDNVVIRQARARLRSWIDVSKQNEYGKPKFGRPLSNRVVVRRDPEKKESEGGIVYPDQSVEVQPTGTALAVGPGIWRGGDFQPCTVKPGDRVMLGSYGGNIAMIAGEELLVICEDDILLILDE